MTSSYGFAISGDLCVLSFDLSTQYTWATANNQCNDYVGENSADWRLPNAAELANLRATMPSLLPQSDHYWSSNEHSDVDFDKQRWYVDTSAAAYYMRRTAVLYARCVRSL
ncbi:MAG: DUF1566 domain-containing protein [Candidatus Symbiothrix sp.]|nr:DUF1566 domain-containing protein [Candidatus Symbiothrix sp.]